MADEVSKSEILAPNLEQIKSSVDATIESKTLGGTESSCNTTNNNGETSGIKSDAERHKLLEQAEELMEKGSKADKERDYAKATDCYSRALEIRALHYGELAPECVGTYCNYGCALLYKAQEEADVLGIVLKKEDKSQEDSNKNGSVKSVECAESSAASVPVVAEESGSSNHQEGVPNDDTGKKDEGDDDDGSDTEDLAEADEDESDLDLAWKMLDVARAIVEKHSVDTMEKVDILSALAEVALEREDIESSICDYLKALSILERLVEPDARHIAALQLEDLQQLVSNPSTRILPDILGMLTAKASACDSKGASSSALMSSTQMGTDATTGDHLDSHTVSSTYTNGAAGAHLGVVGRGVKRVVMNSGSGESSPTKKPALDPPADKGDGEAS